LRHNLTEILIVAVCGILAGAQSWTEIALWGTLKLAWLRRFVPLANGMPSHDTFARVLRLLDAKHFELAFRGWIGDIIGTGQGHIAPVVKTVLATRLRFRLRTRLIVELWMRDHHDATSCRSLVLQPHGQEPRRFVLALPTTDRLHCELIWFVVKSPARRCAAAWQRARLRRCERTCL
jgi:hypothetical protein